MVSDVIANTFAEYTGGTFSPMNLSGTRNDMRGWKTPHIDIPYILTRIGGTFLSRIGLWALIHEVRKPRLSVYFNSTRCGVRKPSLVPRTNLISIGLMRGSIPTFLIAQDVGLVPRTGRHTMVCLYIRLMRASAPTLRG